MSVCLLLTACSTKKNTAGRRAWHAFTAKYNTYYNGNEAYKEGCLAQETGNRDNYTELLPLFVVSNEDTRKMGSGNFETAITKCEKAIHLHSIKRRPVVNGNKRNSPRMKAYLSRKEFNPFLKHAWLLMGKAQFRRGEFVEAASTFSYITRYYAPEPTVAAEARVWLARCYAELDWFYDAEDALGHLRRDSLPARLAREAVASTANLLLRQGKLEEALPYLEQTARKETRKLQRARLYFLLGQVHGTLGHRQEAYRALTKCCKQNPPYELAFNARILQTEALAEGTSAKKMATRLRRMARSENNKNYLDQIYYALGNIYIVQRDTLQALRAYESGRSGSTRAGLEKGVLLLRLGELYWDMGKYDLAQSCYGEAVGLIGQKHKEYEEATRRSKVLDELVPYTSAVHLQDSLQELSRMDEAGRNAAIDRVIEALKRKEAEERRARADSAAEARMQESTGAEQNATPTPAQAGRQNAAWYFYNPMLVMQGKQDFQKQWGRRKNEDNWRRSNRSVLAAAAEEYDYDAEDAVADDAEGEEAAAGKDAEVAEDLVADDPHRREYYMKQIPFTPEALAASNEVIKDALYNAGLIEKDKLEDFPLAAKTLERLRNGYPDFEKMDEVLYQLFLLYSRWGKATQADAVRQALAARYPESVRTRTITDPDFEHNARYGRQIEDSLYSATYEAYCRHDAAAVERNYALSTEKFPTGANRPKFIFVHALSRLGTAGPNEVAAELRSLVQEYPESDVSEMAGMMVKGIESGRRVGEGGFDVGALWARRSAGAEALTAEAGRSNELSADREVPFVCIVAYPTDSLNDGQVLYDIAHFNFTGFMVRNFEIAQLREPGLTQFRISGFRTFDEAHAYAQQLYAAPQTAGLWKQARLVIVSAANLDLLGTVYSFDDYRAFYEKTFAPMQLNPQLPLDMQDTPPEQRYEDEFTPEELERLRDADADVPAGDDGEWYSE